MAVAIKMPQLGLTMTEGTVGTWFKKVGDTVKKGEPLLEVITDKLNNEVQSEEEGVLLAIIAKEGAEVPVLGVLGYIGAAGEKVPQESASSEPAAAAPAVAASVSAPISVGAGGRIKISPLAKKIAQKNGIDIMTVSGTGPGGRIVQKDILAVPSGSGASTKSAAPIVVSTSSESSRQKYKGIRKTIGDRMLASHNEIPSVSVNMKIDVTALLKLRAGINEGREKESKLSINDFVIKAVAKGLSKNKKLLASLDAGDIIYNEEVNIGMAVALEEGLIVPVIKNADKLSVEAISTKAKDLAKRARESSLGAGECQGSTFTISNLGMFGVESFTSIINQPNCAILGVAAAIGELDIDEYGKVFKKQVMRITLTIDHRLMDGADAAKFAVVLKELLETPMNILL
ncbi:MAG: 2-oxo acid dehydrogenase subunit E2 [Elusimicrobiota bacterium]|jgi:pyruvate dehydrogenase E2 component (dihydrolipoamide acetyltransferase)|nr:2-oxo acid dehydrogenase subunit E2 [Elusimicrobiota bacterium]